MVGFCKTAAIVNSSVNDSIAGATGAVGWSGGVVGDCTVTGFATASVTFLPIAS